MIGVVAEFDPFHKGHRYLLEQARALTGETTVVVVMSGSFVQRGAPAIMSKAARVECAVKGGADVVLELPITFALAPAERFAYGAVSVLENTGLVTHLAFGSECGDIDRITRVAEFLCDETTLKAIRARMKDGTSFAAARERIVREKLGEDADLLHTPNDILAVEYVKALMKLGSSIRPVAVRRAGAGHNGLPVEGIASASHVRKLLREGQDVSDYLSEDVCRVVEREEEKGNLRFSHDHILLAALRRLSPRALSELPEVREGMENRIYRACRNRMTIADFVAAVACRRYTEASARRIACYALLGLTKADLEPQPTYLRILGAGQEGLLHLRHLKDRARLPLITKPADAATWLTLEDKAADLADLFAKKIQTGGSEYKNLPYFTKYLTESKKKT